MVNTVTYYILDGTIPKKAKSLKEWLSWASDNMDGLQLKYDEYRDSEVSTVFLMMDYSFGCSELPLLFETAVFGGPLAKTIRRYTTWYGALKGHTDILKQVKKAYDKKGT